MNIEDFQTYQREEDREALLTLEEVATANVEKLQSRLECGKIRGDGDDR